MSRLTHLKTDVKCYVRRLFVCPSINFAHIRILLQNDCTKFNRTCSISIWVKLQTGWNWAATLSWKDVNLWNKINKYKFECLKIMFCKEQMHQKCYIFFYSGASLCSIDWNLWKHPVCLNYDQGLINGQWGVNST